jgi:ABC-type phosphate/phosphonate transport system substrate-binding protein
MMARQPLPRLRYSTCRIAARRALGLLLCLLLLSATGTAGQAATTEKFHTTVGFSTSTFLDVDRDRAQAISGVWTDMVARTWGGTTSTHICASLAEFEKPPTTQNIDLAIMLADEYLAIREKGVFEALFVSAADHGIYDRLVLVTRRNSAVRSLLDLKGKTLIQQKGVYAKGRNLWLDTLLLRKGVRAPKHFFGRDSEALKPANALLPVFFGKSDACVVTMRSFTLMAELNPQLKQQLVILEESPQRPSSIIAVRKGLDARHRHRIHEVLASLDQHTQGKQLLTLFRMTRLVPYRSQYLTELDKLFKDYNTLKGAASP